MPYADRLAAPAGAPDRRLGHDRRVRACRQPRHGDPRRDACRDVARARAGAAALRSCASTAGPPRAPRPRGARPVTRRSRCRRRAPPTRGRSPRSSPRGGRSPIICECRLRRGRRRAALHGRSSACPIRMAARRSSSPARRKASASRAPRRSPRRRARRARVAQPRQSRRRAREARRRAHPPIAIVADLRDADEAARAIAEAEDKLGPIDVLVNSAGAAKRYAPDDLSAQAWHDAMDAKFFSYVHPVDIVVKRMAARGRGAIVNIVGHGRQGRESRPPARRRGQRGADARDGGTCGRVRAEGRARQRDQPGRHADRTRAGRTGGRGEADRARPKRNCSPASRRRSRCDAWDRPRRSRRSRCSWRRTRRAT